MLLCLGLIVLCMEYAKLINNVIGFYHVITSLSILKKNVYMCHTVK